MATEAQILANRANAQLAGRPKLFATKLRDALVRLAEENAEPLAAKLMERAMEGDIPAIKEYMDRALGKALQNVDVTSGGEPMRIVTVNYGQLEKVIDADAEVITNE